MASSLTAAIVDCTPAQFNVVDAATESSALFSCLGDPAATKARVLLSGSFQDNSFAGDAMAVLFSLLGFSDLQCTAVGETRSGQTLGQCTAVGAWVDTPGGLSAFVATVTGGPGSIPLPFNASASVKVETEVPEPASLALAGLGLVLVGLQRRR